MPSWIYKRTDRSNNRFIDLVWKRFSKLIVLSKLEDRWNSWQIKWLCKCDCWKSHQVTWESLRSWKSKSCWCLKNWRPVNFKDNREEQLFRYLYKSSRIKKKWTDLNFETFKTISKQPCYYCWLEKSNYIRDIRWWKQISDTILYYNWLDRLDSNIGYLNWNVVACCKYCNVAKSTMTQEEFKKWIIKIYNNFIIK